MFFFSSFVFFFFFNDTATTEIYTLSLHDALPISDREHGHAKLDEVMREYAQDADVLIHDAQYTVEERSEEHTSELQSLTNLVCRLLLEKKKKKKNNEKTYTKNKKKLKKEKAIKQ